MSGARLSERLAELEADREPVDELLADPAVERSRRVGRSSRSRVRDVVVQLA